MGVPGAAQGAARRPGTPRSARPTSTPSSRWCGRPRRATTSSTTSRRCAAGSSSTSRPPRPTASSSSAPGGCATSSSRSSCSSSSTAGPTSRCGPGRRSTASRRSRRAATSAARTPPPSATAYRLLRTLEHRIQLYRLRRTHLMPTAESDLRRLGRALGHRSSPGEAVLAQWRTQKREVRRLHERIFYRPLLAAVARLSDSEVRLTPEAARERLSALGFRDPARRPASTSRPSPTGSAAGPPSSASCCRSCSAGSPTRPTPMPGCSPSAGSATSSAPPTGTCGCCATRARPPSGSPTPWPAAGSPPTCSSRPPSASQFLGDSAGLTPAVARGRAAPDAVGRRAQGRPRGGGARRPHGPAVRAVPDRGGRPVRGAHPRRAGHGDDRPHRRPCSRSPSRCACATSNSGPAHRRSTRLLVVGMGRLGGAEQGYGSDADVIFVHDPVAGRRRGGGPGPGDGGRQGADPAARPARSRPQPRRRRVAAPRGQERAARPLAWRRTASTTAAGRSCGRRRRCCGPRRSPATPSWGSASSSSSPRCAGPRAGLDRRPGPRDPHPQGADGGRAAPARRRPQDALQARPRRPVRRRVGRPARPAAPRPRAPRAADHLDDGGAARRRAPRPRRPPGRGRPVGGLAAGLLDAQRRRALPGQVARRRARATPATPTASPASSACRAGSGHELGERYRRVARHSRAAHEAAFYGD